MSVQIGQQVITPKGLGMVKEIEFYSRLHGGLYRYGVVLDSNVFCFPVAYFFSDEVSAIPCI